MSGDRFLMLSGSNSFVACWYVVTFGSCAHRPTTETQIHNQIHRRYINRNPQLLRANQVFLESCQHGFCSDQPHVEKKRNDSPIWMFQLRVSHRCCWWCWSIRWHSQNPDAIAFSQNPHPNCIRNLGFTLQTWCLEVENVNVWTLLTKNIHVHIHRYNHWSWTFNCKNGLASSQQVPMIPCPWN